MPIQIVETIPEVQKKINKAWAEELNTRFRKILPRIRDDVRTIIPPVFTSSSIYNSLINGELRAHFGFPPGAEQAVNKIIQGIVDNFDLKFIPFIGRQRGITGGLRIGILRQDLSEVLSVPEANLTTSDGNTIPWLEWLLVRGDEVIITDYSIKFTADGRSGMAIMVSNKDGFWKVPSFAAGVPNRNWLTQSLDAANKRLENEISNIIQRHV